MFQTTRLARSTGRRFHQRVLLLLTGVFVVGCMHPGGPAYAAETGIRGTVLYGPVHPGPERVGQNNEAPLQASFTVYEAGRKVTGFKSDDQGSFELSLPPGSYTIVPNKGTPIPGPEQQRTRVTVPDVGFVTVTIRLDSGML